MPVKKLNTFEPEDLERAKAICLEKGYCSTSHLMLGLKIFYSRSKAIRKKLVKQGFLTTDFRVAGHKERKKNEDRRVRRQVRIEGAAKNAD